MEVREVIYNQAVRRITVISITKRSESTKIFLHIDMTFTNSGSNPPTHQKTVDSVYLINTDI